MSGSRKVLCAIDFSEASRATVREAVEIARGTGARLVLLHVFEQPYQAAPEDVVPRPPSAFEVGLEQARRELSAWGEEAERQAPGLVATEILFGEAAPTIVKFAADGGFDLVVLGTHRKSGVERLLMGSVSYRVMREVHCSALVVRPPAPA